MPGDYRIRLVEDYDDVTDFFTWLSRPREYLGLDTETDGLVWGRDRVRLVQFGDDTGGWSIPFERGEYGGIVRNVLQKYEGNYAFHNAKFDLGRLHHDGMPLPKWRQVHDTFVMSFLNDNQEPSKKLKRLSKKYLGSTLTRAKGSCTSTSVRWECFGIRSTYGHQCIGSTVH